MNRNRQMGRALMGRFNRLTAPVAGALSGSSSPAELRRLADQARARRDWSADIHHRRHLTRLEPERVGVWIQYGHALKEGGFHAEAEKAYLKAGELKPEDPEIDLQLGHLSKVRGDFPAATRWFERARDRGHADADQITFELGLLRKVKAGTVFHNVSPNAPRTPLRVFLSVPGGQVAEGSKDAIASGLGRADYSYSFAMRGFVDALDAMEIDYTVIRHPEYISDIREQSNAEVNLHLSFYPPERLRVLKGAYNVNCFAWEFDRLRLLSETTDFHAFSDQTAMLAIADEIWVPSEHGAEAVRQTVSGTPVRMVAAPVLNNLARRPRAARPDGNDVSRGARALHDIAFQPLAVLPRIQSQMNEGAASRQSSALAVLGRTVEEKPTVVFLSVFNAHDYRKQVGMMIEGFIKFAEAHPEAILLLKMTTPDTANTINDIVLKEQIMDIGRMVPPMISEKVWITKQVLTRDELNNLYDVASYYICTSYAEGQNLPLIEAMGRGVVPVSVDHTAMSSYISEDTAIVMPSERRPFDKRLTRRYGMFGLETNFVTPDIVHDALVRAVEMSDEGYAARSAAALATVQDQFGLAAFAAKFNALTERLTAPEADAGEEPAQ